MNTDSACAEFQRQYSFSYTLRLDLAKISSSSYFVKVLQAQRFQQDSTELEHSTGCPKCLSCVSQVGDLDYKLLSRPIPPPPPLPSLQPGLREQAHHGRATAMIEATLRCLILSLDMRADLIPET